jgi:hypothetical protein
VVVAIIASPYPGPPVSDRHPEVRTSVVPAVRAATRIGSGIDWIELFLQIALAAVGVMLVAGRYRPGRGRL